MLKNGWQKYFKRLQNGEKTYTIFNSMEHQ